jgi:transcriptional regulator with XRE-family HTH domain
VAPKQKTGHPTDIHVGGKVRMRRMMLGLSQEKLGDALGITFQQVQKYEKGVNRIGASRLQQLSEILQVPVEAFFDGAIKEVTQSNHADAAVTALDRFMNTAEGVAAMTALARINRPVRALLVKLIEILADGEATEAGDAAG